MSDLTTITKELNKGKNVEKNLPAYMHQMCSLYHRFSQIKLSMNFYNVSESMKELSSAAAKDAKPYYDRLVAYLQGYLEGKAVSVEALDVLRNELKERMEMITNYVDRYAIYQHICNRVEYQFKEGNLDQDYYETGLAKDILQYLVEDQDSAVVNTKISEVVGELPMRLTRNKFLELTHDAMKLFVGNERAGFEDFQYMLEMASGIRSEDGMADSFPQLWEILEKFKNTEFKDISQEEFQSVNDALSLAVDFLTMATDEYVNLTEVVNDFYVLLLSKENAFVDAEEDAHCNAILRTLLAGEELDSMDHFIALEGRQEKIHSNILANDSMIDEMGISYSVELAGEELAREYENLQKIALLSSGSYFVDLKSKKVEGLVEEGDVSAYFDTYAQKMTQVFREHGRNYNRAVMALVISQLPVFFNNMQELSDYIQISLSQCHEEAEQRATIGIFQMIFGVEED